MKSRKELEETWKNVKGLPSDINIRKKLKLQFEVLLDIRDLVKPPQLTDSEKKEKEQC